MAQSRTNIVCLIAGLGLLGAIVSSCGGSSEDSKGGTGGSGGVILDSSVDAQPDVQEPDAAPDAEPDVAPDQSVGPETAPPPDAEILEGSLFDLTMPDVALNDAGATVQGCYDCAIASCPSDMAACNEDDQCRTLLLCMFVDQCFGGPGGIDTNCLIGCAMQSGITNPNDPAAAIALSAGQCINDNCNADCAIPDMDGGLPFDAGSPDGA